ncbi:hypothetical protein [Hymenobacter sp.]|uniref:hypothetical protein n=1 Tax=Hymenobacter sp. TaxID=1898978 RepID=UPI00286C5329|nr:hypothetical protein [Hymenobacter sp.]
MESSTEPSIFVTFVGAFFFFSGLYSIIVSLNSLGQHRSDSTIETKLFKFNAPVGFTYGIAALLSVVGLVYLHRFQVQTFASNKISAELAELKQVNQQLRTSGGGSVRVFKEYFSDDEPQSILNGKVLVELSRESFSEKNVRLIGTSGISFNQHGPFKEGVRIKTQGRRFYLLMGDSTVWGVNLMREQMGVNGEVLEFFETGRLKTQFLKK